MLGGLQKLSFSPSFTYHLGQDRSAEVVHGDSTALLLAAKFDLEMKLKEDKSGIEEEKGKKFHEITKFLIDNGADVTALGNIHTAIELHLQTVTR